MIPLKYGDLGCKNGDIAIVEVAENFPEHLGRACLPTPRKKLVGNVFAAGYGSDRK